MPTKQYLKWKLQISAFMAAQGESKSFIKYVCDWFDGISGRDETNLIREFHTEFSNKTDDQIFDFIMKARTVPKGLEEAEFGYAIFNSAFFLYKPLLKLRYKKDHPQKLKKIA